MLQDLAALAPPAIVCAAFLVGAWVIVRRELAPRRRQRANGQRQQAPGSLAAAGGLEEGGPAAAEGSPAEGGAADGHQGGESAGREPADAEQQRRS